MAENPLVTVNILSFNRKDELRNTLTKVFEQDYKNIEVIVVDNASSDGSAEMVKNEFPSVQLIQMEKNIGIAGWNEGFKVAKGEYVLVLDDDAYPEKNSLMIAVKLFEQNSNYGIITFDVYNVDMQRNTKERFGEGWLPKENLDCEWPLMIGCSFLIRKNIFIAGMFEANYFICFHELPIINIVFNKGYKVFYSKDTKSIHNIKPSKGYNKVRDYYHFRNMLNFVFWQFSRNYRLGITLRVIIFYLSRSIKYRWFIKYLESIWTLRNNRMSISTKRLNIEDTKMILGTGIINYQISLKFK